MPTEMINVMIDNNLWTAKLEEIFSFLILESLSIVRRSGVYLVSDTRKGSLQWGHLLNIPELEALISPEHFGQ